MRKNEVLKLVTKIGITLFGFYAASIFAAETPAPAGGIGALAQGVTQQFQAIGQLMAGTAYLAGFALTIAAMFKFKQHKDNPTQIPMGTPLAMLVIGICLIFLPSFISPAGTSLFGTSASAGGFTGGGVSALPNPT